MAITKTFVAHSQLNASDLNELKDQANAYIQQVDNAKPDTVDILGYISEGSELPLSAHYTYGGLPTAVYYGHCNETEQDYIAICTYHCDTFYSIFLYVKNDQNKYIYSSNFHDDNAGTTLKQSVANIISGTPATASKNGVMTKEDKTLFDQMVTEVPKLTVAVTSCEHEIDSVRQQLYSGFTINWKEGTYYNSSGEIKEITSVNDYRTAVINVEGSKDIRLGICLFSIVAYCLVLDAAGNILQSFHGDGTGTLIGNITLNADAYTILLTNSFHYKPDPIVEYLVNDTLDKRIDDISLALTNEAQTRNEQDAILNSKIKECNSRLNQIWYLNSYYNISGDLVRYVSDRKFSTLIYEFVDTSSATLEVNLCIYSPAAYIHFLNSNGVIIEGRSIQGSNQIINTIEKPQGAKTMLVTNSFDSVPAPYIIDGGNRVYGYFLLDELKKIGKNTQEITNLALSVLDISKDIYGIEITIDEWVNNTYYDSTGALKSYSGSNQFKTAEVVLPSGEYQIYLGVKFPSSVAYCLFLDSTNNIVASYQGSIDNYNLLGIVTKPLTAVKLLLTNSFVKNPFPEISVSGDTSINQSLEKLQNQVKHNPYCFDLNFFNNQYDESVLGGGTIQIVANHGAVLQSGFTNRVTIDSYMSACDCLFRARIELTGNKNAVLSLSSNESNGGEHASIVVFDFSANKIKVYPNNNGTTIPAETFAELSLTNITGEIFYIEVGRRDRCIFAAVTNYNTAARQEILIDEPNLTVSNKFTYPCGWLHDYVCFSQISGDTCYFQRVQGVVPQAKVVFLGDSITEGWGVNYANSWVKLVSDQIGNVANFGSSGDSVATCQKVIDTVLKKYIPNYVVVTIGTNGGTTLENMTKMRDSILELGAVPIFNYIYRCDSRAQNVETTNAIVAQLGCDGARFDLATSINNDLSEDMNTSLYQSGNVHLNDNGNSVIASRFLSDLPYLKMLH